MKMFSDKLFYYYKGVCEHIMEMKVTANITDISICVDCIKEK